MIRKSEISYFGWICPILQQESSYYMSSVGRTMGVLNDTIGVIDGDMSVIDHYVRNMSVHVGNIRYNVHQIARPMGKFNQLFPD